MKNFKTTALTIAAALICMANQAEAVSNGDLIGSVDPGSPSNPPDVTVYVQTMVSYHNGPGGPEPFTTAGHTYDIQNYSNADALLPSPVSFISKTDTTSGPVVSGAEYVLAKYGNVSFVWYLGGSSFDIPDNKPGPGNQGISNYALFGGTPPQQTPDGGATAALLGIGLIGLVAFRQKR